MFISETKCKQALTPPPPAHCFLKAQYSRQERVKLTVLSTIPPLPVYTAGCLQWKLPAMNSLLTSGDNFGPQHCLQLRRYGNMGEPDDVAVRVLEHGMFNVLCAAKTVHRNKPQAQHFIKSSIFFQLVTGVWSHTRLHMIQVSKLTHALLQEIGPMSCVRSIWHGNNS